MWEKSSTKKGNGHGYLATFNCQLDTALISITELPRSDWTVGISGGFSWMLISVGGPSPLWAAPDSGQPALSYIRRVAKHELERMSASSVHPWFLLQVPCPGFSQWWIVTCKMKQIHSSPMLLSARAFCHTNRKETSTLL